LPSKIVGVLQMLTNALGIPQSAACIHKDRDYGLLVVTTGAGSPSRAASTRIVLGSSVLVGAALSVGAAATRRTCCRLRGISRYVAGLTRPRVGHVPPEFNLSRTCSPRWTIRGVRPTTRRPRRYAQRGPRIPAAAAPTQATATTSSTEPATASASPLMNRVELPTCLWSENRQHSAG
jgi:hypothetical protein